MMVMFSRRSLLKQVGFAAVAVGVARPSWAGTSEHVVIIGGGKHGFGFGAQLLEGNPKAKVTLIETNLGQNQGGGVLAPKGPQLLDYQSFSAAGGQLVEGRVLAIDWASQRVALADKTTIAFDRLVMAPGVRFMDLAGDGGLTHAWGRASQANRLEQQIAAMDDGAVVVISAPKGRYRYQIGPYERASVIASYLKVAKPRSKVLILDGKDSFPEMDAFLSHWQNDYPQGMISWVGANDGGAVEAVIAQENTVYSAGGIVKGDVLNIIPPQQASQIAGLSGLVDHTGWCPVDQNGCSTLRANVMVLGDAAYQV